MNEHVTGPALKIIDEIENLERRAIGLRMAIIGANEGYNDQIWDGVIQIATDLRGQIAALRSLVSPAFATGEAQ